MKLRVTIAAVKSYTAICSGQIEIDVDTEDPEYLVAVVGGSLRDLYDIAIDDFYKKVKESKTNMKKAEVIEQYKKDESIKEENNWEQRNKITELQTALARKECQIDGMIKGMNKEYVATPDEDNIQLLEDSDD